MINKKLAFLFIFLMFFLSGFFSYLYFSRISYSFNSLDSKKLDKLSKNFENIEDNNEKQLKTEECPINGVLYSKNQRNKWEKRRPLGITVENHIDARPQSGLSYADVVFEAVAEGGITRFLAVYYCQDSPYVGPIRSARIYFIKMLQGFGNYPLYAHVGGANTPGPADALGRIRELGWVNYNDLNQFSVPFPYFWRDYERLPERAVEHTVYSSTSKLWDYAREKRNLTNVDRNNISWDKNYQKWLFKDDEKLDLRGDIKKIDFGFWENFAGDFSVTWSYNKDTNDYLRINGGVPHIDKNNNKQISAKNVIIIFAKESPANDGYPGGHLLYDIVGKGEGLVFQDGKVIKVSWVKQNEEDQFKFYDQKKEEIKMVRGSIWIEILPIGNKVNY